MLASAPESREELTSGTSYSPPPAFGRFKLLHQIGAGVLGPVFRTHDPDEDRLVAVKAFTLDVTPEQAAALASELDRLAGLDFDAPSVTAPVAAGVEDFVPYVAVPYVSGESLDAAIRQYGPAPAGDAIRLIGHVAEALDAAAHLGVFHGSMHPRDILVTPGETHVTGFGVAQALERVGLHGPVRRPYVAPEREGGDAWGAAADIYALAVIAYEVLTGRRALPGTDQPLPGLNDLRVHDQAALREAIETALDPDPGRRPARARDFATAFAAALSEAAVPGVAGGDRSADRRPRKPRARAPKLPGLDEPLQALDSASTGRPKTAAPAVSAAVPAVPEAPSPAAGRAAVGPGVEAPAEQLAATGDIRYVPVTDPADAGERPPMEGDLAEALTELSLDPSREPAAEVSLPASLEPAGQGALADDVAPRGDASGETVDAELAAALDPMAADGGHASMPTPLGIDIFGPGPATLSVSEEVMGADARVDPAADTALAPEFAIDREPPIAMADSAVRPATPGASGSPALDFTEFDATRLTPEDGPDSSLGLDLFEAVPPPESAGPASPGRPSEAPAEAADGEPARAFVRGRAAERRRTPSRYGRSGVTPDASERFGEEAGAVPRAFEPERPTPPAMPGPDFELLTRPVESRPPHRAGDARRGRGSDSRAGGRVLARHAERAAGRGASRRSGRIATSRAGGAGIDRRSRPFGSERVAADRDARRRAAGRAGRRLACTARVRTDSPSGARGSGRRRLRPRLRGDPGDGLSAGQRLRGRRTPRDDAAQPQERAAGVPHDPRDKAGLCAAGADGGAHARGAVGQAGLHARPGERARCRGWRDCRRAGAPLGAHGAHRQHAIRRTHSHRRARPWADAAHGQTVASGYPYTRIADAWLPAVD